MGKKFESMEEWDKAYQELESEKNTMNHHVFRFFQMMGNESDNFIYLYDIKNGVMINCQKTASILGLEEMVEKSPEELAMMDFVTDESKEDFAQLHRKMIEGAQEAKGIVKLKQVHGVRAIYEIRLKAYFDEAGVNKEICMVTLRDITEAFLKEQQIQRYLELVEKKTKFEFTYQKNADCFTIFIPEEARRPGLPDCDTHFFFTKMVKDEKVCRKADIPILQKFLEKGTNKTLEINMYDNYTEEHRWYLISGQYESESSNVLKGTLEDITAVKMEESNENTLKTVLDCLGEEYVVIMEIDLQEDAYRMLLGDYWRTGGNFPMEGVYTEAHASILRCVQPKYVKARQKFGDIKELKNVLRDEKRIECEYKVLGSKVHGRKAIIQVMEKDEYGEPTKALLVHLYTQDKKKIKNDEEKIEEVEMIQQSEEVPVPSETVSKKNWKKVLLTEHYGLNAQFAKAALEQLQLNVCVAEDYDSAMEKMEQSQEGEFAMVFLDMDIPQQDGYKIAKKIRKGNRKDAKVIPLIAMSVHDIDAMGEKARDAGINEALLKPLTVEQIEIIEKKYADFM